MQVYAAMIDVMDQNIGRVVDYVKSSGKWENTLWIFLSDNGASAEVVDIGEGEIGAMDRWASLRADWANVANTPFRSFKNYSYEGGIATPMIVHWPAGIRDGGQVDHTPLHFIDIVPTLIDITGAEYPSDYRGKKVHPLPGQSILPLFRGEDLIRKQPLFFHWRKGRAIRTDDWKLVGHDGEWELYDMRMDRTERNNVARENPEVVTELEHMWEDWADGVN